MLKFLDPMSAVCPRKIRNLIGLPSRSGLGCIIRPGGLGDLAILTLAALRLNIDVWRLVWVIERRNRAWCELLKLPFICYDEPAGIFLAAKSKDGFDWAVNSEQTFGLAALFASRLVPHNRPIFGFETSRAKHLHDFNVFHLLGSEHELASFTRLLSCCMNEVNVIKQTTSIELEKLVLPTRLLEDFVVVAVGGRQDEERRLPVEQWKKIVEMAWSHGKKVYLIGAREDTKFSVELMVACPEITFNFVGKISFENTVSLIRSCRRMYAVDSGLVHVASVFDVPVTTVFTKEDMLRRWSPLSKESRTMMDHEL